MTELMDLTDGIKYIIATKGETRHGQGINTKIDEWRHGSKTVSTIGSADRLTLMPRYARKLVEAKIAELGIDLSTHSIILVEKAENRTRADLEC